MYILYVPFISLYLRGWRATHGPLRWLYFMDQAGDPWGCIHTRKSPWKMCKSTISMAMFNSFLMLFVCLPEGSCFLKQSHWFKPRSWQREADLQIAERDVNGAPIKAQTIRMVIPPLRSALAEREFFLYALLFHAQIWELETEHLWSVPFGVKQSLFFTVLYTN